MMQAVNYKPLHCVMKVEGNTLIYGDNVADNKKSDVDILSG
jgi:hypothetical protein